MLLSEATLYTKPKCSRPQSCLFRHNAVACLAFPDSLQNLYQNCLENLGVGDFYFTLQVALLETDGNACEGAVHRLPHIQQSNYYVEKVNSSGHVYELCQT